MRELEAVRTIKHDRRRIQRDPNSRSLLESVRSLGDDPRKVGVHFNILGEATPLLVDAAAKGGRDLIPNLHRDTEVGSSLDNNPCKVTSEDSSWVGDIPRVYGCKR